MVGSLDGYGGFDAGAAGGVTQNIVGFHGILLNLLAPRRGRVVSVYARVFAALKESP